MPARKKKKAERTDRENKKVIQRQKEMKAKFVIKLKEMPIIQVAAAQTGIHRDTYYEWRNSDRKFKEECEEALSRGCDFVSDMAESMMVKKIKEGNMTSIIFWLKNHHLQYNDKRYHEHKHYFRDDPLTEERMEQIMTAMKAWDSPDDEDDDEREEDYVVQKDENGDIVEPSSRPRYDDKGNLIR